MEIDEDESNTSLGRKDSCSVPASSSSHEIRLIYNRLPKLAVNTQVQGTSIVTPDPVPKNSLRSRQLQSILQPLNLALLDTSSNDSYQAKSAPKQPVSDIQARILQSLIRQNPSVLSLPDLKLKANALRDSVAASPSAVTSPSRVLEKTQRNFMKAQTPIVEGASEILDSHREYRLHKILENVRGLDASIPLKKKAWMMKPKTGMAKDKLRTQLKAQKILRRSTMNESRILSKSSGTGHNSFKSEQDPSLAEEISQYSISRSDFQMKKSESDTMNDGNTSDLIVSDQKKLVLTKAQLKEVPKKNLLKSRHRVLVLQRKYKIRPGTTFKCRRTRERFRFTSVHRTITESGLSLLTAAYALKHGAMQKESRIIKRDPFLNHNLSLPPSIELNCNLKVLAQLAKAGNSELEESTSEIARNKFGDCHCQRLQAQKSHETFKIETPPIFLTGRKSSLEHPSMILVNRYTQALPNTNAAEARTGGSIFQHTIELLAYAKELERKIQTFKTEYVLLDIGKRPQLKPQSRDQFAQNPVYTIPLEKNSLKEALSLGICDFLAHSGFNQATLPAIELLSEILESQYEKLALQLKSAAEKEVVGISHGFLDPMDRVTTALGLGGVLGVAASYKRRVLDYHNCIQQSVDKLENKLGTLMMTYKLKGNLDSSSTARTSPATFGLGNVPVHRIVKIEKQMPTPREHQTLPMLLSEGVSPYDSKSNSTAPSIDDLSLNLQIDSVPSLSSV